LSKPPGALAQAYFVHIVDSPTMIFPSTEVDESVFVSERFIISNRQWVEPEIRFGEDLGTREGDLGQGKRIEMAQIGHWGFHYLGEERLDNIDYLSMKVRCKVLGVGGCGCNSINRLKDMDTDTAELIAFNTDVQKLYQVWADRKLLLGQDMLHGLSTGGSPYLGRKAARTARRDIGRFLKDTDVLFLVAGLGGGTGSGAAPEIASQARRAGALTIGLVVIPFSVSGRLHRRRAQRALGQLRKDLDAMIVVPNDHLLELHPSLPVEKAFALVDEALRSIVVGISRGMTRSNLPQLRKALGHCEVILGLGRSEDIEDAVDQAVEWPLSEYGTSGDDPVLVFLEGGIDLDRQAVKKALARLSDQLGNGRQFLWALDQGLRPRSTSSVTLMIPSSSIRKELPTCLEDWLPAVDGISLMRPQHI
jgi:cell division protein FtsZ